MKKYIVLLRGFEHPISFSADKVTVDGNFVILSNNGAPDEIVVVFSDDNLICCFLQTPDSTYLEDMKIGGFRRAEDAT